MERSIHDEFVSRMIEEVKKMKIGDPLDRSTAHGPQNHKYVQCSVGASTCIQSFLPGITWISCWSTARLARRRGLHWSMVGREWTDKVRRDGRKEEVKARVLSEGGGRGDQGMFPPPPPQRSMFPPEKLKECYTGKALAYSHGYLTPL